VLQAVSYFRRGWRRRLRRVPGPWC
jgi:hypothetical protein